ncbi:putative cyclin-A3-1 [Vicia villosa]|uniref:putative cyclin-A3-1 n=1 Tax=Vicia villosa TaxID=3911 RepID=UPI00273BAA86|nr:putative cyclin-A3-1 [Vicia villosa]
MPTRSSRKSAIAEPIVLNPKKHRVVLGDLPNLQNASISETQSSGNLQQHMFTRLIILIWINRFRESTTQNMKSNRLLNRMEMEKKLRLMVGYIENGQRFITTNTSGILVDWLVKVLFINVTYGVSATLLITPMS